MDSLITPCAVMKSILAKTLIRIFRCQLDIVTLSDFSSPSTDKVQVYISGTLHGDERIGPQVAYYLIEYLLTTFGNEKETQQLLKTREIIVTPMTNAVGYYHNEREERLNKQHSEYTSNKARVKPIEADSMDINRDFPYNVRSDQDCLNTIAGRVIHQIFTQNLIVSAITFHGGTNVIGYPWGSFNRVSKTGADSYVSKESPDLVALDRIAQLLKSQSGEVITSTNPPIDPYIFGDISSTIYPVNGGLEDWAYGAGWDYFTNN